MFVILHRKYTTVVFLNYNMGCLNTNNKLTIFTLLIVLLFSCNNNEQQYLPNNKDVQFNAKRELEETNRLLKEDSNNAELWYLRGDLFENLLDTTSAIESYKKGFLLSPFFPNGGKHLADLLAEKNDSNSLRICNFLIKNDTAVKDVTPYYIKANYYSNIGDTSSALNCYSFCIEKDWTFINAYLDKAALLFRSGKIKEALVVLTTAQKVSSSNSDVYLDRKM
jgi:tetratricopeptide (TPR) repeat protein